VPDLKVSAFPVRHAAPDCFGFLFEETPRQPLNGERLAELGVPEGEERGLLARGQSVTLADGRRVEPWEVLGPERRGARIAVVGDAESTDDLLEHVRGVDLLVIEATFMNADADKAEARSHLTVGQATRLAERAGVGELWLNHQSNRYARGVVEAEARAGFGNARVAGDFDRVAVG
jgi:ribonuclease Z